MPHQRTDIAQDDIALQRLSGCRYKVLRALVNRADKRGICFPGDEYLAQATGYTRRSVQRSLEYLELAFLIQYHRKDEWDNLTRRQLPNVMQINPDYISLAPECQAEARELWDALILKCGNDSVRLWSRTITNTKEPIPKPIPVSSSREPTPPTNPNRASNEKGQKPGQGQKPEQNTAGATKPNDFAHQREAQESKSSVPPPRPKYANPQPVNEPLPDGRNEQMAASIRDLGIGLPLARGFIAEYGFDRAKSAFAETVLMGEEARNPAAVFRSILQTRLADEYAVARQKFFNNQNQ